MEKEGFIRSFEKLRQEVKLAEVCTYAHLQIFLSSVSPCYLALVCGLTVQLYYSYVIQLRHSNIFNNFHSPPLLQATLIINTCISKCWLDPYRDYIWLMNSIPNYIACYTLIIQIQRRGNARTVECAHSRYVDGSKNLGKKIQAVSVFIEIKTSQLSDTYMFLQSNVFMYLFRQDNEGVVPSFCSGTRISAIISGTAARWLKTMMTSL